MDSQGSTSKHGAGAYAAAWSANKCWLLQYTAAQQGTQLVCNLFTQLRQRLAAHCKPPSEYGIQCPPSWTMEGETGLAHLAASPSPPSHTCWLGGPSAAAAGRRSPLACWATTAGCPAEAQAGIMLTYCSKLPELATRPAADHFSLLCHSIDMFQFQYKAAHQGLHNQAL